MSENPYTGTRKFFGCVLLMFVFATCGWAFLTLQVSDEPSTKILYSAVRVVDMLMLVIFLILCFAEAFYKPADIGGRADNIKRADEPVEHHRHVLTMETLQQQERRRDLRARHARAQKIYTADRCDSK